MSATVAFYCSSSQGHVPLGAELSDSHGHRWIVAGVRDYVLDLLPSTWWRRLWWRLRGWLS